MSTFDDNYYVNHLEPLYNDSGIYNVDPLLFSLREKTQAIRIINAENYFKDLNTVYFRSDSKNAVDVRSKEDPESFNMLQGQPVPESQNIPNEFSKLSGSALQEYASVVLSKTGEVIPPNTLLRSIHSYTGTPKTDLEKSHNAMHEFMRTILLSVGKVYYKKVMEKIRMDPELLNTTDPWNESRYNFAYLSESKFNVLVDQSSSIVNVALCKIVSAKARANLEYNKKPDTTTKKYIKTSFLDDLQYGNFKGPLYYNLRTILTEKLSVVLKLIGTDNENTFMYVRQLAADIYLKTCYPVIIYDYIHCMMNLYVRYGDFVNSRIALLAKVMFTYYFFSSIVDLYKEQRPENIISFYNDKITLWITKMDFYLQNVNNIDMQFKDTNMMNTIVKDLHKTSATVIDKNQEVLRLQKEIRQGQLALRNVISNTDQIQKQYKRKVTENLTLVCVLLILLVSCTVLIFLKNDANKMDVYALYVAGGVALCTLTYFMIKNIYKLIASSKKSS